MNLKQKVGIESASYVKDGMIVGLGTGSTAYYMIEELGRRVKEEGLDIVGVPTSKRSEEQALSLGIPLKDINTIPFIDLTIDGSDEIDYDLSGIKGGGGALLFEKIVANLSKKVIWIADVSKKVEKLGKFPLPVEVIPFGSQAIFNELELKGYHPKFRTQENERYYTDSGNYIIDLHLESIADPKGLAHELKNMVGVVEHGLFIGRTDMAILASNDGIEIMEKTV